MVAQFNATFGSQHNMDFLKRCFKKLKKLFNDIKVLLNDCKFVWDEMRQMITGDNHLWDAFFKYLQDHPNEQVYRGRPLLNYNDLFLIYGKATTNWMHYPPSHGVDVNNNTPEVNSGEEDDPSPTCSEPLLIHLTMPMDEYLINLMLEQAHGGNKIGHTFSEQAWAYMLKVFYRKFCLLCDKYLLENRYLNLLKE